ncbi:hypothetical protein, partial [Aeromonas caviae]|uniref:hypothetical protein n=1 Tax=Aeromonas caviae TaxID=648 RepID=UPI001CC53148
PPPDGGNEPPAGAGFFHQQVKVTQIWRISLVLLAAPPSPADEKIRLLRAVRYHHLAVARELFVAEGRKAGLQ